jgi:hypothetical protein
VASSKHNGQASTNCVDAEDQDQEHTSDKRVVASFSSEEYQALMALLKSNSRSAGESSSSQVNSFSKCFASSASNDKQGNGFIQWILDNGATDHVCNSLSLFTHHRSIPPLRVKLPNGSFVSTEIVGDIQVTSTLTIHGVLYMPNFHYNLISLSKIVLDLDCRIVFTDDLCLIQTKMQKMIWTFGVLSLPLQYMDISISLP